MAKKTVSKRPVSFRPNKQFFIDSITRDIDLEEAILDLIDNSIDGFLRSTQKESAHINIKFDRSKFLMEDDCGGIAKERVYDEVFRIGPVRKRQESKLGVFGIGLKRAMFKMGRDILVESDDGEDCFSIHLNEKWLDDDNSWDIGFSKEGKSKGGPSFRLLVKKLFPGVVDSFESNVFLDDLRDRIRNVHSIYLSEDVSITVNGSPIEPLTFEFLDDGTTFKAFHKEFYFGDVEAEIIAGFSKEGLKRGKDVQRMYGWYVFCNNRIVTSNDTSSRTGFTDKRDGKYHYPQDSRILGLAFFRSRHPDILPWRTTKGDVNLENKYYRALQTEMRKITRQLLTLTRALYKADPETDESIGKSIFEGVLSKSWEDIPAEQKLLYPDVKRRQVKERIQYTSVTYHVTKDKIRAVKKKMGNTALSNKEVGKRTFDYYCKLEKVE